MLIKLQNNIKQNIKFNQCIFPFISKIKTLNPLRAIASFGYLVLLLVIFTIFHTITSANNVNALSISVSYNPSAFDITNGAFSQHTAIVASVTAADSATGYTLNITGPINEHANGRLLGDNGTDTSNTLASISGVGVSSSTFTDNTWGWKFCKDLATYTCAKDSYDKAPTETTEIDKTISANSTPINYALAIGAKVGISKAVGTYSGNFTLTASENPVYHSVGFVDWTENMPEALAGVGTIVDIPSKLPSKPGYTFKGWCTTKITNGTCMGEVIARGTNDYGIVVSDGMAKTNLYTIWEKTAANCDGYANTIMQNITSWKNNLVTNIPVIACDNRDGSKYTVAKLADNKIWMLDNLDLGPTAADLSSTDTHIPADWPGFPDGSKKLPASGHTNFDSDNGYINPAINNAYSATIPSDAISTNGGYKAGTYYNYCAASAGTICATSDGNSDSATYDICPSGWRLPTGGAINTNVTPNRGEFQSLYNAISGSDSCISGCSIAYDEFRAAFHLPFSGVFHDGSITGHSWSGNFWSSTRGNAGGMYYLTANASNSIHPEAANDRFWGLSVRCVAQ